MKFNIDELEICFPYDTVYKEQFEYMRELKKILDNSGHGILEMPTGTGKTVSLLALIMAYLEANPTKFKKLVYCTRTVVEMEKTIEEVKFLISTRKSIKPDSTYKFLCTGLSARSNLCIHPTVSTQQSREKVDSECKKRTAPWVRLNSNKTDETELCNFFETFDAQRETLKFEEGVYNMEDLRDFGAERNVCPYFLARQLLNQSNIIVYNYLYMLDAKMTEILDKDTWKDCIVVFDEAHNIDNVCLEVFTVDINRKLLDTATKNIEALSAKVNIVEQANQDQLEREYQKLLSGLRTKGINVQKSNGNGGAQMMQAEQAPAAASIPSELAFEAIPFHIRKAKPFIQFLKNIVIFLRNRLKEKNAMNQDPPQFLSDMFIANNLDQNALKMTSERLNTLLNQLEVTEMDQFVAVDKIARFTSLLATHTRGFKIIHQPNPRDGSLNDPVLTFTCLDSSLAMAHVFEFFKSVILTSGTMSPLDIYPKMLNFKPFVVKSIDIELTRNSIHPIIATKSQDSSELSSEYEARQNMSVTRSYANLLIDLATIIPDGIVCFFPSYMYMEQMIFEWNQEGLLDVMRDRKLLFFESKDSLMHYRSACNCGRGALFFSIARGKIAEGIDFNDHFGRCVVMVGFPVQNSKDPILLERAQFLTQNFQISKNEYIEFDAMRQTAQCLGRVMRGKMDYGIMIMAEKRFARNLVKGKLPSWIKKQMPDQNVNVSVDMVSIITQKFFKQMGKHFELDPRSFFTQKYFDDQKEIQSRAFAQAEDERVAKESLEQIKDTKPLDDVDHFNQRRLIDSLAIMRKNQQNSEGEGGVHPNTNNLKNEDNKKMIDEKSETEASKLTILDPKKLNAKLKNINSSTNTSTTNKKVQDQSSETSTTSQPEAKTFLPPKQAKRNPAKKY